MNRSLSELARAVPNLLSESYEGYLEEFWENKRMTNALTSVVVRLHRTGCSIRETTAILA